MARKPWMRRKSNETETEWHRRLNRTCYACGEECATRIACDDHEATCLEALHKRRLD